METSLPVLRCVFLPPCFLHFASHLRVSLPVHTQPGTERQKEITSLETSPLLSHSSPAMKLHVSGIKLYPIFLFFSFYFVWRELRKRDTEPEIHFDYIL